MLRIHVNDTFIPKKETEIIHKINQIILSHFADAPLEQKEIRIFFKEDEAYYRMLGYEKPYRNLKASDGFYDKEYQEIFIRLKCKSIIRTYVHELGHYFDYNLKNEKKFARIGSAFGRKIMNDMPFEDQVVNDIKKMPAFTLISVASSPSYILSADEVFARMFEVFIWENLGRRFFTPDLYIHTPKLFLFLNRWLGENENSFLFKKMEDLHHYLLNRSIKRRKAFDPYKQDIFSHYVKDLIGH